jgi:HAD superfamily phosphoserine phosphatase-like hydrolase
VPFHYIRKPTLFIVGDRHPGRWQLESKRITKVPIEVTPGSSAWKIDPSCVTATEYFDAGRPTYGKREVTYMQRVAFCFDLDGTVIRGEILPHLARSIDLADEMQLLTTLTMQGAIPFEHSFRLRVKLLSEIPISTAQEIVSKLPLESNIIRFIQSHNSDSYLVTGNLDVWIKPLIERIGCQCFSSQANHSGDRLLGIKSVMQKEHAVKSLRERYERIVAIGDGMNDAMMLQGADVAIAYGGFRSPVENLVRLAHYVVYNGSGLCHVLDTQ